jgi:hypothetical protein
MMWKAPFSMSLVKRYLHDFMYLHTLYWLPSRQRNYLGHLRPFDGFVGTETVQQRANRSSITLHKANRRKLGTN